MDTKELVRDCLLFRNIEPEDLAAMGNGLSARELSRLRDEGDIAVDKRIVTLLDDGRVGP